MSTANYLFGRVKSTSVMGRGLKVLTPLGDGKKIKPCDKKCKITRFFVCYNISMI